MLPFLLIYESVYGAGSGFYKVNSRGYPVILFRDPQKHTKSVSLSEICEVETERKNTQIFIGTPFSPYIFNFYF